MVGVLADPALYEFIGGRPPSLAELRTRYRRQLAGRSADGSEEWHNWIVRLRSEGMAVGFVQATIVRSGTNADIAWLIGVAWQRRGFAVEAARALIAWLEHNDVMTITAHIHPDHVGSAAVAHHSGLRPTDVVEDGEQVWRRVQPT